MKKLEKEKYYKGDNFLCHVRDFEVLENAAAYSVEVYSCVQDCSYQFKFKNNKFIYISYNSAQKLQEITKEEYKQEILTKFVSDSLVPMLKGDIEKNGEAFLLKPLQSTARQAFCDVYGIDYTKLYISLGNLFDYNRGLNE